MLNDDDENSFEEDVDASQRTNRVYLYIASLMIILFLLGLGAILFLVFQSNTAQIEMENKGPYYDKEELVFPEVVEDWKFAYINLTPIYYCKIENKWHQCYPTKTTGEHR